MQEDKQPDEQTGTKPVAEFSLERRQLIRAALSSAPLVLTVTAGTARAQGPSVTMYDSGAPEGELEDATESVPDDGFFIGEGVDGPIEGGPRGTKVEPLYGPQGDPEIDPLSGPIGDEEF